MTKLEVKPLSVNDAWKGRRYKTKEYKSYQRTLNYLIQKETIPNKRLTLVLKVGYSSSGSDIDNFLKPFLDILSKKNGFNDNKIYTLLVDKELVSKGKEFIDYKIYDREKVKITVTEL